jgi:hypothetical protein
VLKEPEAFNCDGTARRHLQMWRKITFQVTGNLFRPSLFPNLNIIKCLDVLLECSVLYYRYQE